MVIPAALGLHPEKPVSKSPPTPYTRCFPSSENVDNSETDLNPTAFREGALSVASREPDGLSRRLEPHERHLARRQRVRTLPAKEGFGGFDDGRRELRLRAICGRESSPWCRTRRFEDGRRGARRDVSAVMPQFATR